MTRVLIADDQALVRAGIRRLLETTDDLVVAGEADDGVAAIAAVRDLRPDVVLMDIRMPNLDGIEAVRRIRSAEGGPPVVMLTTYDLDEYLYDALAAGASGFLLKHATPEELLLGVRAAAVGDALVSPALTRRLVSRFAPTRSRTPADLDRLTDRETEVFGLIIRGRSNSEISEQLFIGDSTVKTHVARVLMKLGIRDRAQAVIYGYETGMVAPGDPVPE
jgi:DNA-binding NarL/FixJ family response regulator